MPLAAAACSARSLRPPGSTSRSVEGGAYRRQDSRDNYVNAARIGMQPVSLQQFPLSGYAIKEKRVERHAVRLGQRGVHRLETPDIIRAEIGRGAHAGEQHGDMPALQLGEDGIEIGARLGRGEAAQHVIGAEL